MTKTKITIGQLCDSCNIPDSLIRAVIRQFGGWKSFTEAAPDVTRHGNDGEFGEWQIAGLLEHLRKNFKLRLDK